MQRILVLNPKGGSGKTTIATNLASYFASQGDRPLLQDNDPQASSSRWLKKRKPDQPFIHGVAAFERNSRNRGHHLDEMRLRRTKPAVHVICQEFAQRVGRKLWNRNHFPLPHIACRPQGS